MSIRTLLITVLLFTLVALAATAQPNRRVINSSSPGERLEIDQYLVARKTTVVVMVSKHCPHSQAVLERVEELATLDGELSVRVAEIDRQDSTSIDWGSPLAHQYRLRVVPFLYIFDPSGEITHQGYQARKEIERRLDKLI